MIGKTVKLLEDIEYSEGVHRPGEKKDKKGGMIYKGTWLTIIGETPTKYELGIGNKKFIVDKDKVILK